MPSTKNPSTKIQAQKIQALKIQAQKMVTVRVNERCLALNNGIAYAPVTIMKVNKTTARVQYPKGEERTIPLGHVWKQKKKKKNVRTSLFCKNNDNKYTPRSRSERFALSRRIAVHPLCFGHGFMGGDFRRILMNSPARYKSLCIFNDNTPQWEWHGMFPTECQGAGGGNACARPWQSKEDAIGIPTGPFGSLTDTYTISFGIGNERMHHTAKEIIDEAIKRIVQVLVKHPEKEAIYYSVDNPTSNKIGLAIFSGVVGDDVVDYITQRIIELPRLVRLARLGLCLAI
jgi:hypothetical protein